MLRAEKVVSEVETAQDVKTASDDADCRYGVVVHAVIVAVTLSFLRANNVSALSEARFQEKSVGQHGAAVRVR